MPILAEEIKLEWGVCVEWHWSQSFAMCFAVCFAIGFVVGYFVKYQSNAGLASPLLCIVLSHVCECELSHETRPLPWCVFCSVLVLSISFVKPALFFCCLMCVKCQCETCSLLYALLHIVTVCGTLSPHVWFCNHHCAASPLLLKVIYVVHESPFWS